MSLLRSVRAREVTGRAPRPPLSPRPMASASLVLGGLLLVAAPAHAVSVAQLAVATVAAAGALFVVVRQLRPAVWMTPFNPRDRPRGDEDLRSEVDRLRTRLGGGRVQVAPGLALPPEVVRVLQPIVRAELEGAAGGVLAAPPSATLQAILRFESPDPRLRVRVRRGDEQAVSAVVHEVLDELDRLRSTTDSPLHPPLA